MPVTCSGCGESFKSTGWKNHIRRSKNRNCKPQDWSDPTLEGVPSVILDHTIGDMNENEIVVDPRGDFFGDYDDLDNFAEQEAHLCKREEVQDENEVDNEDDDLLDAMDAEQEMGLEVPRISDHSAGPIIVDDVENTGIQDSSVLRLRGGAEETLLGKPVVVKFPVKGAGAVYSQGDETSNNTYVMDLGTSTNPFAPFESQLEWEIAKWAKLCGPSSTAFTELIKIEGVVEKLGLSFASSKELNKLIDKELPGRPCFERHEVIVRGEVCKVFYCDMIACIQALLGDPDFAIFLVFLPEKHYTNEDKNVQLYHDMHTGKWWWSTQELLEKDNPGATIVPIIISTDKTQLTLFRNKSAYPIYITIGNIPKEIHAKPSNRAYILLGYLPTTRLENVSNKTAQRHQLANLYHACMKHALKPLESAGINGVFMTTGDSLMRCFHPIVACVVTDYPEQYLTACTYNGECPTCPAPRNSLGDHDKDTPPGLHDLSSILEILDSFETDPAGFLQACKGAGIKPIVDPYWKDLPYVHIYRSITPDILHQLYQGILKHLIHWVIDTHGAPEIDARCQRLPPNHNTRLFMKGISTLSRVTGQEHDQMCRILLGLIIDAPLPNGLSSARLLSAVRAMLDFLYLAQYPVHTDRTLELLDKALSDFHKNKQIFVDLGIHKGFNIPKLHWASHYVDAIKLYGTTDNVNTQYTEHLHIDLAKMAYAATNRKDEFSQMTAWLERKEKILRHMQYIQWQLEGSPAVEPREWLPPGLELDRTLHMTKHPSIRGAVSFDHLSTKYGATFFRTALAQYVITVNEPALRSNQVERRLWTVHIPFTKVHVWHKIKFLRLDPVTGWSTTADSIHVRPARLDGRDRLAPARFDTALINDGTGDVTGIEGLRHSLLSLTICVNGICNQDIE
ncbi:hypothetical protein DXG01_001083 [Tephrocybe rancida]|nr:hypothetical protein DXG01_001083 [Tephrocybe rancida]